MGRRRTSESHPIGVDSISGEELETPGRLGMTILPGVKDPGRWDRDLGADLRRLSSRHGADVLVNLLEPKEFERYGVPDLLGFFDDSEAVAGADEATLRRLLTLHVRRERSEEDHLLEVLRSGHVAAVLRRAAELWRGKG